MRVQVHVPQDVALQLKMGMEAALDVPELPGRVFKGKVARTANALDQNTRTLLVEADIDNPDRTLSPGLYGTVHYIVPRPSPVFDRSLFRADFRPERNAGGDLFRWRRAPAEGRDWRG